MVDLNPSVIGGMGITPYANAILRRCSYISAFVALLEKGTAGLEGDGQSTESM